MQGGIWIDATKELPEERKLVFIKIDDTIMVIGRYIPEQQFGNKKYPGSFVDFNGAGLNRKFECNLSQIKWLKEFKLFDIVS